MKQFKLPDSFLVGTANSAFQSEGAYDRDGKSPSVMDYYAKEYAGKYQPGYVPGTKDPTRRSSPFTEELPDRGCFFYDQYEAYIDDMKRTGQHSYRMSIAWPRMIPTGFGAVNPKAIEFYNKVIDKLLECGIEPFVDLYHWDLPQCLMELGGFRNENFPQWFEDYARVCFESFGDRVKLWSTFNESAVSATSGYGTGRFPPFECDRSGGHLAAHNVLLAHFRAVRLYRSMDLGGKIGAVNCIVAVYPAGMNAEDAEAAARQQERRFDWWMEPMTKGTYPQRVLRECPAIRDTMPPHYQEDLDRWFAPMDFVGLNYYFSNRVRYMPDTPLLSSYVENFFSQPDACYSADPPGMYDCIMYVAKKYDNIEMYISENGLGTLDTGDEERDCCDDDRIAYIRDHMRMIVRAIDAGANVNGYYYWNDADSYEELGGYTHRFGLTWVDKNTGRFRWKKSREYYRGICTTRIVD